MVLESLHPSSKMCNTGGRTSELSDEMKPERQNAEGKATEKLLRNPRKRGGLEKENSFLTQCLKHRTRERDFLPLSGMIKDIPLKSNKEELLNPMGGRKRQQEQQKS